MSSKEEKLARAKEKLETNLKRYEEQYSNGDASKGELEENKKEANSFYDQEVKEINEGRDPMNPEETHLWFRKLGMTESDKFDN